MRRIKTLSLILMALCLLQTSCQRKQSEKPREVYRLWAGEEPPADVKLLKAKYWQSAHFTKEYIMYMELTASTEWIREFVQQNKFEANDNGIDIPADAPAWFKPPASYKVWTPSGFSQGSKCFIDSSFTHMFLYEVQL